MRASLLLLLLALATAASAQFTSGFETWTDTVPSDWMGSKTTLSADSVAQVSNNPHGGTYAVRLTNSVSGHKRFTTQSATVVDGTTYDVTYWVRGNGSVRTGLFDGRAAASGYASYTPYYVSTGNAWTQVTQQITAANDTTGAQFILSIQLTSGPEHLVIDDVNITGGIIVPPVDASIYEIQYTTDLNGVSPFNNQAVNTGGIVTGVDTVGSNSYFIQSGTGPWSGIYVFDNTSVVALGDSVTLTATVTEFNTTTELTNVSNLVVVGQYPQPAPQMLDATSAAAEQWEGVLTHIAELECMNLPDAGTFFEWTGTSWQGSLPVDDLMYLYAPTVGNFYNVTGVMHFANGARKIEPRGLSDFTAGTGLNDIAGSGVSVFPNPASAWLTVIAPDLSGRIEYTLSDVAGRTVRSALIANERCMIDVSGMPAGFYTLTLRNGSSVWSTRVSVQR